MHGAHSGSADDGTHPFDQSRLCKTKSGGFLCSHISSDDCSVILTTAPNHTTTVLTEGNYCSLMARKDTQREREINKKRRRDIGEIKAEEGLEKRAKEQNETRKTKSGC